MSVYENILRKKIDSQRAEITQLNEVLSRLGSGDYFVATEEDVESWLFHELRTREKYANDGRSKK